MRDKLMVGVVAAAVFGVLFLFGWESRGIADAEQRLDAALHTSHSDAASVPQTDGVNATTLAATSSAFVVAACMVEESFADVREAVLAAEREPGAHLLPRVSGTATSISTQYVLVANHCASGGSGK
jgi:hypothetical protein